MPNPPTLAITRRDLARAAALLPDRARPRLRMEHTLDRTGTVDGAWWPRTSNLRAELPGLVTTLAAILGPVVAVGVDTAAWTDIPARITVDGHIVRIIPYAVGDSTMTVVRGRMDHFLLLVLPPPTSTAGAGTAMALAVRTGNAAPLPVLLAAAAAPDLGSQDRAADRWEDEGGALVGV
ncbi:DUF5994 family protein [Yinghuangia aomiensis]|uniref:DUF5994 family protein n=1 Tax=Yinghuangia aomiensis TaxID=676205 RepID=A0ABP9I5D8_9ACTN